MEQTKPVLRWIWHRQHCFQIVKIASGYYITVSWSNATLVESSRFGNDETLSTIEETKDGSSPKHCLVLTFLICNQKKNKNTNSFKILSKTHIHRDMKIFLYLI